MDKSAKNQTVFLGSNAGGICSYILYWDFRIVFCTAISLEACSFQFFFKFVQVLLILSPPLSPNYLLYYLYRNDRVNKHLILLHPHIDALKLEKEYDCLNDSLNLSFFEIFLKDGL